MERNDLEQVAKSLLLRYDFMIAARKIMGSNRYEKYQSDVGMSDGVNTSAIASPDIQAIGLELQ